jgi:hypothetical protein
MCGPMDAELATETQGFKPRTPGVEMAGDALPLFLLCINCSSLFPFSTSRRICLNYAAEKGRSLVSSPLCCHALIR